MVKKRKTCPKCGHPRGKGPSRNGLHWGIATFVIASLVGFIVIDKIGQKGAPSSQPAPERAAPWTGEPSEALLEAIAWGVVKIETGGLGRPRTLGSGFVYGEEGLIVTNLHVIAEATQARVRFADGSDYEVLGYAAVSEKDDLAILKIGSLPLQAKALSLAEAPAPAQLATVFAVGHPHGLDFSPYDGRVSLVVDTADLPAHSQQFLQSAMGNGAEHQWIQHTALISEGNSGGPLLDRHGQVVGINTWVDTHAHFGYALLGQYLQELEEKRFTPIAPLDQYAKPSAQLSVLVSRLTPDYLEQLATKAEAFDWRPQTDRDYTILQQLSWYLTFAISPESLSDMAELSQEARDALALAADQIIDSLSRYVNGDVDRIRLINDFSVLHLNRPQVGIVFVAEVERVVSADEKVGAILNIEGHDQPVYLSLNHQLNRPEAGTRLLLLGINQGGEIHYGQNPLHLNHASVVTSRILIPLASTPPLDPSSESDP